MSKTFKTIPQLLEENKRLLQDKKRLDWLEERGVLVKHVYPESTQIPAYWIINDYAYLSDTLRDTIDTLMEAAK